MPKDPSVIVAVGTPEGGASDKLRLDKWLWYARFFKTRTLAATQCRTGKVRLNGETIAKAHNTLRPGDTVTFQQGPHVRVVRVLALGSRRGPAPEAKALYDDLAPLSQTSANGAGRAGKAPGDQQLKPAQRDDGAGRPTKRERRAIDRFLANDDD